MKYQLSIIQHPSGRFGYVGSVPADLAIRQSNGQPLTSVQFAEYKNAQSPSMIARGNGYVVPSFETY